ncbi:chromate efflux transporter [Salinispira pacifica]|uniref:Chromate ion transporter n=1 Tax=Salinispira pacifica TaxID=1307761 RepID=V5WKR2_9SPIO|nr:chromate efflux transporter [Salinispira pacifica]AHC16129.1 Chromate ion transporter [Salinispira pacifica]
MIAFLRDVFLVSLQAFGGPQSHISVFEQILVKRRGYLNDEELMELLGLCSMLPGPTSTQTIVSVGYKQGGRILAVLTLVVWALPILIAMGALSFFYASMESYEGLQRSLRFVGPMALGFIIVAAFRIGRKVIKDLFTGLIFAASALITFFFSMPWIFPLVLVAGGGAEILRNRDQQLWNRVEIKPRWSLPAAVLAIALINPLLTALTGSSLAALFESFFRYGYLVFGGGQVIIPMMYSELVELRRYLSSQEFLAGYGLVQGLPGPMFSFTAFAGGLAMRTQPALQQVLGIVLSATGIFLPGLLLIFFVYPLWQDLKKIRGLALSVTGISAAAGGLLASAAPRLIIAGSSGLIEAVVSLCTVLILGFTRLPPPILVLGVILAGLFIPM